MVLRIKRDKHVGAYYSAQHTLAPRSGQWRRFCTNEESPGGPHGFPGPKLAFPGIALSSEGVRRVDGAPEKTGLICLENNCPQSFPRSKSLRAPPPWPGSVAPRRPPVLHRELRQRALVFPARPLPLPRPAELGGSLLLWREILHSLFIPAVADGLLGCFHCCGRY